MHTRARHSGIPELAKTLFDDSDLLCAERLKTVRMLKSTLYACSLLMVLQWYLLISSLRKHTFNSSSDAHYGFRVFCIGYPRTTPGHTSDSVIDIESSRASSLDFDHKASIFGTYFRRN